MIVDIVDKYCTNDNNPIKNLRLKRGARKGSTRSKRPLLKPRKSKRKEKN
jgi:hypothetical protein